MRAAARAGERGSSVPLLFTILFLIAGLLLCLTSTVPALREREHLQKRHVEITKIKERLDKVLTTWRGRERAMDEDIETLLVEIDALGLVPEDLLPDAGLASAPSDPAPSAGKPPASHPRSFSGREPSNAR